MADWGAIAAGAGEALNSLGTVWQGLFNANQGKLNRKFQERMYEKQKADNIEFWNMQNEYNLPSAQLQRLKDAGLNPYLMYGNGGVSNVATGAPQSATAPHGAQASVGGNTGLGRLIAQIPQIVESIKTQRVQQDLLKAEEDKAYSDSYAARMSGEESKVRAEKTIQDVKWKDATWKLELESISAENNLKAALRTTEESKQREITANIQKLKADENYIVQETANKKRLTDQEVKESNQRIQNSIKTTAASVALMNAEARKALADAWKANAERLLIDNPTYRQYFSSEQIERYNKLIMEGDAQALENELARYLLDMKPEVGSGAYDYRQFLDWYVTPLTESLGKILGGSASLSYPIHTKKP